MDYSRPEFDLLLRELPNGVEVTQHGRTYLAKKWKLTDEVLAVLDRALHHGLTHLWQDGHPSRADSNHISFSFSHDPSTWVFVIGGEALPPRLRCVTFHRRLKEYFKSSGLGWVWSWETSGGKNILLDPQDLASVLRVLPLSQIKGGALPITAVRGAATVGRSQTYYKDELSLELALHETLVRVMADPMAVQRQRRFAANNPAVEVASRPDILVAAPPVLLIMELKLYGASESEIAQLQRYIANAAIAGAFKGLQRHGALVAERFEPEIVAAASHDPAVSLYTHHQDGAGNLQLTLVTGRDVLKELAARQER